MSLKFTNGFTHPYRVRWEHRSGDLRDMRERSGIVIAVTWIPSEPQMGPARWVALVLCDKTRSHVTIDARELTAIV